MTRIKRNTGRSLEAQVQRAGDWYRQQGLAWLERVEPPQRWVNGKPIIVRPALADFLGCYWSEGRAYRVPVAIECKSITGRHDRMTLAKVLPRVDQRQGLHDAASIWSVIIAIETDIGDGVGYYTANMPLVQFKTPAPINLTPCAYLPNGAPDILGLR